MKQYISSIVLAVLILPMSGCLQNLKNRDCPVFNHPSAKQWQPVEIGNSLVFTNADGESEVYLLQSIVSNEPYVASVDVNSSALDTPICELTQNHIFISDDGSHEVQLNFAQQDKDGINPELDSLAVKIELILADSNSGEPGLPLSRTQYENLLNPHTVVDDFSVQPHFLASKTLDSGQTYTDVIVFPSSSIPPEPAFQQYLLSEILLGRNVGLIQLSRNNGDVFTVVP